MLTIRTVLHPTDFSEASRPALELAGSLARDYGAELVVLHVLPMPVAAVVDGVALDLPTGEADHARARLDEVRPTGLPVLVTRRLERGDAVREVLRVAGEVKADLIVMGTHGHSGLSRLLAGSTAEGVMRKAPCPVVTVKPGAAGHPEPAVATAEAGGCWPD